MSKTKRHEEGEIGEAKTAVDHRIDALEKGIQRWRCLTAAGFLTAIGAFWVAVFGLSQFENTYFIGEVVATLDREAPAERGLETGQPVPLSQVEPNAIVLMPGNPAEAVVAAPAPSAEQTS